MSKYFKPQHILLGLIASFASTIKSEHACAPLVCASVVKAGKVITDQLIVTNPTIDGCAVHTITQADFLQNGTLSKTLIITEPGYYKFCENIDFVALTQFGAAVIIDTDDMVLDLNGKVLNQANSPTISTRTSHRVPGVPSSITGIIVNTGHNNVTILGNYGAVTNFSQRGIYVQGGNNNITIGNDTQLLITGCGHGTPVSFVDQTNSGEQAVLQAGLQVGEMQFLTPFGFEPSNGLLKGLSVRNVILSENNAGCALGDGSNYFFNDCTMSFNRDTRPVWPTIGYGYFGSTLGAVVCYGLAYFSNPDGLGIETLQFDNCDFNSNVADASIDPETFSAYCDSFNVAVNFSNLKISNCRFNNNNAKLQQRTDVTQFNQTRGCVIGGGTDILLQDSEFSNNLGGGLVDGLNISGKIPVNSTAQVISQPKSFTIRNCIFSNNKASTNGAVIANPGTAGSGSQGAIGQKALDVVGCVIRFPHGLSMIDCVIEDNTAEILSTETDYLVYTDGILLFADNNFPDSPTNNVEIRGAKISRNRNNGVQGTSAGITTLDGLCENITIVDSVITENSFPNYQPNFFAAGIDITGMTRTRPSLVSVINCIINNHASAGIFTSLQQTNIQGNTISFNTWGVILGSFQEEDGGPIGYPIGSSVLNNTFLGNGTAVEDQPSQALPPVYSTSLVSNNLAFNNELGYLVTYEGDVSVPVEFGTLSAFPPYPPSVLASNIEIVPNPANQFISAISSQDACKAKNEIQACTGTNKTKKARRSK
ncbi:MAG: hypothetical protein AB7F19_02075 [Candidatus Babeliales bacterium]